MKPVERKDINRRISVVSSFFAVFFLVIIGKAVYLQVFADQWLAKKAADQYERTLTVRGARGTIYDSQHKELAVSIEAVSVAAYPRRIKQTADTADTLAQALGVDARSLRLKLIGRRSFVWVKRQVTPKEVRAVKACRLKGIGFITEHSRYYPNRQLAAQVVGFSGIDGRGLEGLEFYYNDYLEGKERKSTFLRDALGKKFDAGEKNLSAYSGNNIVMTIDSNIQYFAEKAIKEAVTAYSAKSAMAIVMVPDTGEVLAMANYPSFNPNSFRDSHRRHWRNRTVADAFEPGSTLKIFSAAAAIEHGGCTPNTIFYCENGQYKVGSNVVHDTHSYGWLSLQKIIQFSSNIGAIKMSEMIGPQSLYLTLSGFGFGMKTEIDSPGETPGSLSHYAKWSKIDTGAISFGHGISVSALQMVAGVSAIANGGILMKPLIVKEIQDRNGKAIKIMEPRRLRRVISQKTADTVKKMMATVVDTGGTGTRAALERYKVCGKTGTAQKIKRGVYSDDYLASFIGFAPAENPKLAVLVVVDEPQGVYYGGIVAAPAFKKICQETLNYLNVPPSNSTERLTAFYKKDSIR